MKKITIVFTILLFLGVHSIVLAYTFPPENLVGTARNSAVFLQWKNSSEAIDHVIEYKQSGSSTWNTYPHSPSGTSGIVVGGLSNGTSYDFQVSTISTEGTSSPISIFSITPTNTILLNSSNNHIISTGQSNATGSFAIPILSTTQPYTNRMLNEARTNLVPLVEPITGAISWALGETMSSGLANSLSYFQEQEGSEYSSIVSLRGDGALAYSALMQGTDMYNALLSDVVNAKNISLDENKTHIVRALTVVHGETDESSGVSAEQYEQYLVEWQEDYENDIKAITGQEEPVPMFTDQMSSWMSFGSATPHTAIGQYNATKNNPDKIILVAPKYIFDVGDWMSHMKNYSYRRLGEYYAKVYKKVVIDGEEWKPLMPEEVTMYGNEIYARFHVPVLPLAFDTTAVLAKANYGFEYADSTNSAQISSVEIISPDTVKITLTNTPTGSNPKLRYAFTGIVGSWTGSQIPGSARGNLRDSDMTPAVHQDSSLPSYVGNYLHNWALTFDEPITVMPTTPSAPVSVTATLGSVNGTAVVSFALPAGSPPATSYLVTSTPGNIVVGTIGSPVTISGLSNNTTYTFTVVAQNGGSQSAPSAPSNSVTPYWITEKPQVVGPLTKPKVPIALKPEHKKSPRISIVDPNTLRAAVIESVDSPEKQEIKIEKIPEKTIETKAEITEEIR